jgi:hypothetical protein
MMFITPTIASITPAKVAQPEGSAYSSRVAPRALPADMAPGLDMATLLHEWIGW